MKTFNYSHLASQPAPANEISQVLNNLEKLMRKHAVNLSIRHIASRDVRPTRTSPIPHMRAHRAFSDSQSL